MVKTLSPSRTYPDDTRPAATLFRDTVVEGITAVSFKNALSVAAAFTRTASMASVAGVTTPPPPK